MHAAGKVLGRLLLMFLVWMVLVAVVFLGPFSREEISMNATTPLTTYSWYWEDPRQEQAELTKWQEYMQYLGGVAHGYMGETLRGDRVTGEILQVFHRSAILVIATMMLSFVLGVVGVAVLRLGRGWVQWLWSLPTFVGLSLPETLVAGVIWSAVLWAMLGWGFKPFPVFWIYNINWRHYVLPTIAMSVFPTAYFARATHAALAEAYTKPFIQVARAKGLSEAHILFRHAWRHVAYRISVILPSLMPWILSALIIVEHLFLVPGLGRAVAFMLARGAADPALMSGILTVFLALIALIQLGCAYLGSMLDPREGGAARVE